MKLCEHCQKEHACLRRPKNRMMVCKECFYELFETEIHDALVRGNVFSPGDRIAIGVSGGKGEETSSLHFSYGSFGLNRPSKFDWIDAAGGGWDVGGTLLDSTVLAHVLKTLNDRYKYGVELTLLSVDEGIRGYRDFSLEVCLVALSTFSLTATLSSHSRSSPHDFMRLHMLQ
eukprot:TRINITY_DN2305_c0_g1_i2.p1 TRINITY_DN2305_c0_g1~~TRINITY_DN2305_c0_g1_i2.p1  ORF type:complete len:173 (+),score=42.57 TRINITY_DN2305_c0_g1_i2:159-677(+)